MNDVVIGEHYALDRDVDVVRRPGRLLLFAKRTGTTVRVSPAAADLLPLLQVGAGFEQLRGCLQSAHPDAPDVDQKLRAFLRSLGSSGVLRGEAAEHARRRGNRRFPLFPADGIAWAFATPIRWLLPGRAVVVVATIFALAAVAAVALLAWEGRLPRPRYLAENLHWAGLMLFALVVVPMHELAHAVACRLVGIQAGKAGIVLHGGFVPGPYVETNQTYLLTDRWKRFVIPAAGPFVNLVAAGVAAAVLASGAPSVAWVPALHTLLFACLLFVYFDTNPFAPSDGSHCAEALLEDELARRHAMVLRRLSTRPDMRAARRYRMFMLAHLMLATALFVLWIV